MGNSENMSKGAQPIDVVCLKVNGGSTTVNTIRDHQSQRGISLICPFPVLEVDVPISFGIGKEAEMRRGSIHRISVEDDPETGLPKLRLSIRTGDTPSTVISPTSRSLAAGSSHLDIAPVEPGDGLRTEVDEPITYGPGSASELENKEPAWIDCREMPLPADIVRQVRTGKKRDLTGVATWMLVFVTLGAVGYLMHKTGLISTRAVDDYIAGFSLSNQGGGDKKAASFVPSPEPLLPDEKKDTSSEPAGIARETMEEGYEAAADTGERGAAILEDEENKEAEPEIEADTDTDKIAAPYNGDGQIRAASSEAQALEPAESPKSEGNVDGLSETTVLLPTRWAAKYSTAYRVREPAGVVVDVPGSLVKSEGWLDIGEKSPMIRSIKAIQRETGARFVVYINGDLPQFMTSPRPDGVSLRLYYDKTEGPGKPEQIALLE